MSAPDRSMWQAVALGVACGIVALALTALAGIGVAAAGAVTPAERPKAGLKAFGSCDGLRGYLRKHRSRLRRLETFSAAEDTAGLGTGGPAESAPAPPITVESPTNVQEAGVDEPDLVKTDGSTIYVVDEDRVRAVDTTTPTPTSLGSLEIPGGGAGDFGGAELLLSGDRLLVIANSYGPAAVPEAGRAVPGPASGPVAHLTEVDVSDPAKMRVVRTATVEGSHLSSRLTGTTARVVISTYPVTAVPERGHGRALVPTVRIADRAAGEASKRKLVHCDDVRRPRRFAGTGMLTVLTIDLDRGLPAIDTDAVMTDGQIVYASPTSLYVATERWFADTPSAERLNEVSTAVHRFDTSDPLSTSYVATGKVPGFMMSQWSLSEHEGVLRVASTTAPPWIENAPRTESESIVTALATDGDALREVGSVGGLGRGEQIYAVRFIGELGYVVTFRQVDPLYVIDLSDPTRPAKVGELKVPGYSAYLHPVGDGLLLGVGQDATEQGRTTGVQVSLFDISDPGDPVRLARESFGGDTFSEVEYDHHAFAFFAEHGLAILPIEAYGPDEFFGAAGLRIGAMTLGRIAKVSHGRSYDGLIRRSLELRDRIYTISGRGVGVHDPATLAEQAFFGF